MTPIFLFGTLCHKPLLELVADVALPMKPAALPGYRAAWVASASWPMLERRADARAEGVLVTPDDAALARLDFYEACFGYVRRPLPVAHAGSEIRAEAWFPADETHDAAPDERLGAPSADPRQAPGADWSLSDWAHRWGAQQMHAAAEVMRQHGVARPADIARRIPIIHARAAAYLRAADWRRPGLVGSGLSRADATHLGSDHVHDGFFTTEELQASHRRFDGASSGPLQRSVFRVSDAVTVLPYDPVRDRVLLVEQFRFGPFVHGDANPWLLEPIAGLLDAGETPEDTARREALEEANLTLGALHFIARYYPTPGGVGQVLFSYLGLADLPERAAGLGGHAGEGEDILSHLVPFDLAERLLAEGDMVNASMIVSMQYLIAHRDRLRADAAPG